MSLHASRIRLDAREMLEGGALPELGYGIAVKCDDGQGRAAEVAMATVIARLLPLEGRDRELLARFVTPTLRNWQGTVVGGIRPTAILQAP